MSSPLYLIRHPVRTLSPALYSNQDLDISACTLTPSIDLPLCKLRIVTIHSTQGTDAVTEETLTYGQLLDMLIRAEKVITV
jgi:hypothetical protein